MKKKQTKALKLLYVDNPWLKEIVASLEAQVASFESECVKLEDKVEDALDEVDTLETQATLKNRELHIAHLNFASLNSRYEALVDACAKLMQQPVEEE